jgi:predicted  nucleic acid-binding Zn-ribbon protein
VSQVLDIVALQELDDEAATLRAALVLVEQKLAGNTEIDERRRRLVELEKSHLATVRSQRKAEDEVESLTEKLQREEGRLYDGSIKNPKELLALQHEIDLLKPVREKAEVQMLELMAQSEGLERERQAIARELNDLEHAWDRETGELRHELNRLNDAITRADVKREIQKQRVPARALALYEDLRRRKGGMAVSRVRGGTCGGCRVHIPDAVRRKAFASSLLAQCPNCDRILMVG